MGDIRGRLLVALPALADPNFDRTVVLVLEHDLGDGAVGVVLNRPSATMVSTPLPEWQRVAADPGVVFVGGPVAPNAAIGVARSSLAEVLVVEEEGWSPLFGALGTVDLHREPETVGRGVDAARIFAGYAGWGAGQLEGEIAVGAWLVVDAVPADALCPVPEELWRDVLRRQPGRTAWLANFPQELDLN